MYELLVIGAGWAGFNAALKARALGLSTCVIESREIGGTCLNRGCIPTKSLIQSAKIYSLAKKASVFGVKLDEPAVNFAAMQARKNELIGQLASGMRFLLKGVDFIPADAEIVSEHSIKADGRLIEAKSIIVATGSEPVELGKLKLDNTRIISSEQALQLQELPPSILIIGGGVIGCEFASLFCALGSRVSVAEKMPQLLPGEDTELSRRLEAVFKKRGIKVHTSADAFKLDLSGYSKVLVCVGRKPSFGRLDIAKAGLQANEKGIITDDFLATNIANIYAAGDCTARIMLAHYAAYQGRIAAENIFYGNKVKADATVVPNCIFTDPEIASVGLSEEKAASSGKKFVMHKFDFKASAMARIIGEETGFIKVLSDKESSELLGACIIGPKATELIAVFAVALSAKLKLEALRKIIFAHPTLSEAVGESLQ